MKKTYQYLFGASLALVTFSFIGNASAQSCATPPTCAELGYNDTAERCEDDAMLKCPFDQNKVFCREKKYTKVCDTVGDVLLDNKLCAYDINDMDPNRTPIGVVFDVEKKLAIALEESPLAWASRWGDDIPELPNYTTDEEIFKDFNGKSNTAIIIAHGDANGYDTPAADYCYNYTTIGTNKGDWYLPAAGELKIIYNNRSILDKKLENLRKKGMANSAHQSSSEYDKNRGFMLDFYNGLWNFQYNWKYYQYFTRPVINY